MHYAGVDNYCIESAQVRFSEQARASIFTHQKFISSKIMMHILLQVKEVFDKDLESMLIRPRIHPINLPC